MVRLDPTDPSVADQMVAPRGLTHPADQQGLQFPMDPAGLKWKAMPRPAQLVRMVRDERCELLAVLLPPMVPMAQPDLTFLTDLAAQQLTSDLRVLIALLDRMGPADLLDRMALPFLTALPCRMVPTVPLAIEEIVA